MNERVAMKGRNAARWRAPWAPGNVKLTPPEILEPVRAAMGGMIGLDPCTEPDNPTRARAFHALPDNGLAHSWIGRGPVWINPPWGASAQPWIRRALEVGQAGERLVLLIPDDTDTEFGQAVLAGADQVTFISGRIVFGTVDGRPFRWLHGAMLGAFNVDLADAGLGVTMRRAAT